MAVTFDAVTGWQQTTLASSKTQAHTVGAGSNRGMVVLVAIETASRTVSGITYNGVSLTNIGVDDHSGFSTLRVEAWKLAAPATGTNNVVISIAGGTARFSGGIYSCSNVDQTDVVNGTITSAEGSPSSNPSMNVTTVSGELVVDLVSEDAGSATAGAGQTKDYDNTSMTLAFTHGSREAATGTTTTMSWTTSSWYQHIAVSFKEAASDINVALSGSASTGGSGTGVPGIEIGL